MNDSSGADGSLTYADSGVDIDKANKLIEKIKTIVEKTPRSGVIGGIGGFGGLFSPNLSNIANPVLVSATDGVGTKLKIAFKMDKHDTIGIDLVAMCVNDILVQGAKPLFFLDYLAMGALNNKTAEIVIDGIAEGCIQAECAPIGGETAEMPGMYKKDEYDLSGFSVGLVDNEKMIDGSNTRNGHKLVGLASSGIHSNGFSLVRKVFFEKCGFDVNTKIEELGCTLGEELLKPTKIYVKSIISLLRNLPIHGMAHITGGGIEENIIRSIPNACKAVIKKGSWDILPIFDILKKEGSISDKEMYRTFNNGIGMILVVPSDSVEDILDRLAVMKEKAFLIGDVVSRNDSEPQIQWT